ncbi:glycosyltransferase family 4 protein [Paracraurococcus lichenis]|uniref:Glycosyltransferase n=1 Tax=Paracraurococcus lichenis TaxID=3064888 RepID=A0ABT9DU24_9PROT|nr:glycosyltransferase [Paracraurococcus sp. LOR1-02]MDO9707383.1 glycosyltransferase [Paracraurococcus sp. LOR1-02]
MIADTAAEAERLLEEGDRLRDRRAWADAAEAYGQYLRLKGEDWGIWVQYGHCLKETGDPKGALLCYREAEKLHPQDSDLQLQIGHALKLLGRAEEALGAYAMALSFDPGNLDAQRELLGVEAAPPATRAPAPAAPAARPAARPAAAPAAAVPAGTVLLFDASDLLDYFRANRAPTGIQRVQLNIIREALAAPGAAAVLVTAFDPGSGAWKQVPAALFGRLAALSGTGTDTAEPAWREAVEEARTLLRDGPAIEPAPGSTLVNLGTSWWLPDYLRRVREAKARHGLRYVPFLHDCIPLVVPEHCEAKLVDEFARWFAGLCLHADAVLANSDCTRADFERLRARLLPAQSIPCFVVPLDAAPEAPEPGPLPPAVADGRHFVLTVGTIESRKNHLLVFQAWLTLLRRHGPEAVPDLVCVGKQGWLAEEALRLHARSPLLQEKVHLLHAVPDTVLEALYRGCLFTLCNSFYEGWGLPVTESLAHGKVPLVPNHSGFRESGAEGAVFFAPNSEPELAEHAWWLATDAGHRRALEARIHAGLRLRTWSEIAAQVMRDAVAGAGLALPAPLERIALPLGQAHPLRLLPGPEPVPAMALADALREGPGWGPLERWGSWARPGASRLRLPLPAEAHGAPLRLYLEIRAPASPSRFALRVAREGLAEPVTRRLETTAEERLFVMLPLPVGGAGDLLLSIEPAPSQEPVGICSLMACRADDLAARLDYLEAHALARLPGG